MCWHKWSKWTPVEYYIDTSFGGKAKSTRLVRRCYRCGRRQRDFLYATALPLEEWP